MEILMSEEEQKKIGEMIGSEESVVGIDARKTHIIIIHQLNQLSERLDKIESRLQQLEQNG